MTSNRAFTRPGLRRLLCSLFIVAAAIAALGAFGSSRAGNQGNSLEQTASGTKIAPWVTEHTANGQQAEFLVVLTDQADLGGAAALPTKNQKGRYVYDALWNKGQATQGPILQWLSERQLEHQSFYIVNAILVRGSRQIAEALAARLDVARVEGNPQIQNSLPQPSGAADASSQPGAPAAIEPGIVYTHAPDVWALGFTGQNIVVASADTGVRWTHNALKPHYRGWDGVTANHDYNWHDSIHSGGGVCGPDSTRPCDDFFLGSHTTGTAIGDDGGGNQVGVAPGAKWIGCRNMDLGNGTPATYSECFQFMMAPTDLNGQNPNPALRAHVINNSWECPSSEGCAAGTLETIVNNTQAAGVFVEASAQNSGPGCSTVQNPPAIYSAAFSTGAYDISNTLASFSSRGPSLYYTPALLKPNISGPGVNNRSAYNTSDTSYTNLSG